MKIEKRIKLNNNNYYIEVDVEYKNKFLYLKNYHDDHYDGGNFSNLIEKIEENYTLDKAMSYDKDIGLMADVLYIYERIPFLSGITDFYISSKDNIVYAKGYISKEEIEKYIKENNINIRRNNNFKLRDGRTWKI